MKRGLHLFEGFGIELEYMIVDARTLDVMPVADRVLKAQGGRIVSEVEAGSLRWSNELALHVVELKTNGPAAAIDGLAGDFQQGVTAVNRHLASMGGRLMPTAMHPWMNPYRETRLWPYDNSPVYEAYNRIFGCRGHGWSNLQSAHINLPFHGDEEFGRLHAAVRLILPILPALAASSPVIDGALNGVMDSRLQVYRFNQQCVPQITAKVIPERVFSRRGYRQKVLEPMYRAIAPYDTEGTLQHEWLNSRGAIARFERNTIEIRLLDVQECPLADLAIARMIVTVLRALVEERWMGLVEQQRFEVPVLAAILDETIRAAETAAISDQHYLAAFGYPGNRATAGELWFHIAEILGRGDSPEGNALQTILERGTLASRLCRRLGPEPSRDRLLDGYRELCDCLAEGRLFLD